MIRELNENCDLVGKKLGNSEMVEYLHLNSAEGQHLTRLCAEKDERKCSGIVSNLMETSCLIMRNGPLFRHTHTHMCVCLSVCVHLRVIDC